MTDPHSLLFLSCDLVGSTRYKQTQPEWKATFLSFYRQFPQVLADLVKVDSSELTFDLWKPIGDELIFKVRVRSEQNIYDAVRLWLQALNDYESGPLQKVDLATKGGAFLATVPTPDSEATVPRDPLVERSDDDVIRLNEVALAGPRDHSAYLYDYFGPSIDTGFRVLAACSQRYFTLSVEVAWLMQRAATHQDVAFPDLVLLETKPLKGVWGNRQYPLFAVDREHDDPVHSALRDLHQESLDAGKVTAVCRACYEAEGWPSKIYLPDADFATFQQVPIDPTGDLTPKTGGPAMDGLERTPVLDSTGDALPEEPPLPAPAVGGVLEVDVDSLVDHATFGRGRVIATRGEGRGRQAEVLFSGAIGRKWLLLTHAPLRLAAA